MRKYFSEEVMIPKCLVHWLFFLFCIQSSVTLFATVGRQSVSNRKATEERQYQAFEMEFAENMGDFGYTKIGNDVLPSESVRIDLGRAGDGSFDFYLSAKNGRWQQFGGQRLSKCTEENSWWYGRLDIPKAKDYYLIKASGGVVSYKHIFPRHHWES